MTTRTSARDVECPTCGIGAGLPCRSTTTGRSNTDTHKARHAAVRPPTGPTYAELCAGYGGLGMGAQAVLGGELLFYAEWDDAPSAIMAHHHPDAHNYRDVTAIDWHNAPRVDVMTAGFPCQPFSQAGKRRGANDERHLWPYIAEGIAILRPQLVLLENVRGLMSGQGEPDTDEIVELDDRIAHIDRALAVIAARRRKAISEGATFHIRQHTDDGHRLVVERRAKVARARRARRRLARAIAAVLGGLADIGYDAQWYGFRAADVGAAHGRWRVFIFAWPAGAPDDPQWIVNRAGAAADPDSIRDRREALGRRVDRENPALCREGPSRGDPAATDGRPDRPHEVRSHPGERAVSDLRLLSTPQARDYKGLPADGFNLACLVRDVHNLAPRLLPTPTTEPTTGNGHARNLGAETTGQDWREYGPAIRRWESIIGRPAPTPTEIGSKGQPCLSPAFVEWMMGLPEGHVTDPAIDLTRNERLKALGNGVVPQQSAAATWALVQDMLAEQAQRRAASA